ncbi:nuclear transport factor 2 family protein [Acinetobacter sp. ANC 3832]|uniref:nuclear transport factor 2 family protein n=1 Tax=Acinetobacter sp. ANC 3832 TaxID=1977874 RepID=UPI000A3353CD|nr:nuclear transport factor 2 family protein [Acinetobacter sp. ANC 3832]OTG88744.1 hypothetical protein B9T35_17100 [Acinetobacter sp. ANC 3832]
MTKRSQASLRFEKFIQLWQGNTTDLVETFLSQDIQLSSSHRGNQRSISQVIDHLKNDFDSNASNNIHISNVVEKSTTEKTQISAYFYGETTLKNTVFFGGMMIVTLNQHLIDDIKIQMNWVDGDKSLISHWSLPLERLWKPKDPKSSAIMSELDAIWHSSENELSPNSHEERIAEAWYRYAWALDLADTSLYMDAFTDDAIVQLPPMGTLTGKREIISTLKAFRMPWPSIQHYGEPLQIDINLEKKTADLMLGRIIPQQAQDTEGQSIYAAHYKIELHLTQTNQWKIHRMNYLPGWIRTQHGEL